MADGDIPSRPSERDIRTDERGPSRSAEPLLIDGPRTNDNMYRRRLILLRPHSCTTDAE